MFCCIYERYFLSNENQYLKYNIVESLSFFVVYPMEIGHRCPCLPPLFSFLPLWKTVRPCHNLAQNATKLDTNIFTNDCVFISWGQSHCIHIHKSCGELSLWQIIWDLSGFGTTCRTKILCKIDKHYWDPKCLKVQKLIGRHCETKTVINQQFK